MTNLLTLLSSEFGVTDDNSSTAGSSLPTGRSAYLPSINSGYLVSQTQGSFGQVPSVMSYRDVINKSGISWSNMLKETAQVEFRQLSGRTRKRPSYYQRHTSDFQHSSKSEVPYHWIRTEDLEHKQLATDRPYRNTYGDVNSQPSKLHLSTELPDVESEENALSIEGVGQLPQQNSKDKWQSNKQIARIYNLLHSGDVKQLSRLHVFTRRGTHSKNLPMILPHFQIRLTNSINQVLKEAEIQPEVILTRRPMTSEKFTYRPITEKSSNPELIILKTGKVQYRKQTSREKRMIPKIHKSASASPATELKEGSDTPSNHTSELGLTTKKLPKVERESLKGRLMTKGLPLTPRHRANKVSAGASNLQEAEDFPLSVKITPKLHPANERPKLQL